MRVSDSPNRVWNHISQNKKEKKELCKMNVPLVLTTYLLIVIALEHAGFVGKKKRCHNGCFGYLHFDTLVKQYRV